MLPPRRAAEPRRAIQYAAHSERIRFGFPTGVGRSHRHYLFEIALRPRQARKNLVERAVGDAQVALQQGCQDIAIVGGDGKITALIELLGGKARPVAINPAALHRALR